MKTLDEQIQSLKSYLDKLKRIIMTESSFSFGNTKIVSKSRIDDVICCIQASYPKDYEEYVKRNGMKSLQTYVYFQQLLAVVTKKFFFSSAQYSIDINSFMGLLNTFMQTIEREKQRVIDDSSFKL